jgi:hypothetical protein
MARFLTESQVRTLEILAEDGAWHATSNSAFHSCVSGISAKSLYERGLCDQKGWGPSLFRINAAGRAALDKVRAKGRG